VTRCRSESRPGAGDNALGSRSPNAKTTALAAARAAVDPEANEEDEPHAETGQEDEPAGGEARVVDDQGTKGAELDVLVHQVHEDNVDQARCSRCRGPPAVATSSRPSLLGERRTSTLA
jgi:hypothetical protein